MSNIDHANRTYIEFQTVEQALGEPLHGNISLDDRPDVILSPSHKDNEAIMGNFTNPLTYGSTLDMSAVGKGLNELSTPAAGKLDYYTAIAGLAGAERVALADHREAIDQYLAGAAVFAKQGLSLEQFVESALADSHGLMPASVASESGALQLQPDVKAALAKVSDRIRQNHPVLSSTGMYAN